MSNTRKPRGRKRTDRAVVHAQQHDTLVPDMQVCQELGGISRMTLFRRTQDDPDFPPQVQVAGRNYRFRSAVEAYKQRLLEQAVRGQRQRIALRTREPADGAAQ